MRFFKKVYKKPTAVQSKYYSFTAKIKQDWEKKTQKENTHCGKAG